VRRQPLAALGTALSNRPMVIDVAGGTGSGKTAPITEILKGLDSYCVLVLQHDSYCRGRSHPSAQERADIDYDHPDALEISLLAGHL
jgi:uridine kinase